MYCTWVFIDEKIVWTINNLYDTNCYAAINYIKKNYQSNFSVAEPLGAILGDCPFVFASLLLIKCQLSSSVVTNCLSLSK